MDHAATLVHEAAHADACGTGGHAPPRFDLAVTALFLDVDGTILDIAPAPELVHVPEGLCDLLWELSKRANRALALISGRTVRNLDALFEPLKLASIGCHGAEVRLVDRDPVMPAPALDPKLRARLAELKMHGDGIVVEDKAYSVALHYRLAPQMKKPLLHDVERIAAEFAPTGIELLHGKDVIEVKAVGVSKVTAFRDVMREAPFAGRQPVFLGDDITDESAFLELSAFDGVGISVGRPMANAQFCFDCATDVRAWLASLL